MSDDWKAKARLGSSQPRSLEVPEWGITVYWRPITGRDQEKIARAVKAKGSGSDAEYAYRLLIEKAEDEAGAKLFNIAELEELQTNYDAMVIARIVSAMTQSLTVEQAEKN